MDWLEFVASLVASTAWPALLLAIALLFKDRISELFPLLRSVRYRDFQADFGEKAAGVAEKVEQNAPEQAIDVDLLRVLGANQVLPGEVNAAPRSLPDSIDQKLDRIAWVAQASPRAAILESWLELEGSLLELAIRADVIEKDARRPRTFELFGKLHKNGVVDPWFGDLYKQLRRLRNEAAHAPEVEFTATTVRDYVSAALTLANYLDGILAQGVEASG